MNATQRALHQSRCFDELCAWCTSRAEAAKDAREEPLTDGEIQDRENAYERGMGW